MVVDAVRSSLLGNVRHGFLGRTGGVSVGPVASLNVGWGAQDDPQAVAENRRRAVEAVAPGARLVTVHQVHSPDVAVVDEPWSDDARPQADALVTARAGLAIGILTADCTPVLLHDPAGVIGAAHAGWKGALGGVIEATVAAMESLGARRDTIRAAVGPVIARKSYEVDQGFFDRFAEACPGNERFFSQGQRPGHHQFDLEAYVASRLAEAGVRKVEVLGLDTYSNPDRFFSYRRATHLGEPTYGRQISLISL